MLVERGLQVMHADAVRDAYFIAWNYLRRSGAISETTEIDERLVAIIRRLLTRGEVNALRLANKAIDKFITDHSL